MGERAKPEADAAAHATVGPTIGLGADPAPIKLRDQGAHGTEFKITGEDRSYGLGLFRHDHELLVHATVAKRHRPSDPNALSFGGGDLVVHPLADHLALELGKGQQHIEGEPAHAGGGVK